eukprot:s1579_g34.t3
MQQGKAEDHFEGEEGRKPAQEDPSSGQMCRVNVQDQRHPPYVGHLWHQSNLPTGASEVPEAPEVTIAPCPFPCIPFLGVLTFLLPSGSAQWPAHRCRLRTLLCWVVPAMARCEPALLFLLPPFVLRRDPACGW